MGTIAVTAQGAGLLNAGTWVAERATVGQTYTFPLVIRNTGATDLVVTSVTNGGSGFTQGGYSGTLTAGTSTTVTVTVVTTTAGAKTANLTIISDDATNGTFTQSLVCNVVVGNARRYRVWRRRDVD